MTVRRFGHYTLLGKLGAGGMGEVSLARDDRLGREVAIKMLPRRLAEDRESLQRFRREALTLASLNHPNIAVIHGFEEDGGELALVLERVEGESLAQRLRHGPLPTAEALVVCVQIAQALEAAHERGIVHRDLKPGNVMLGPRGAVKVLDFGIAQRFRGTAAPARDDRSTPPPAGLDDEEAATVELPPPRAADSAPRVEREGSAAGEAEPTLAHGPAAEEAPTPDVPGRAGAGRDERASLAPTGAMPPPGDTRAGSVGEVSGTPGYMSPEQVRGEEQDPRTDIFAFGCVLYECLTGVAAVPGTTVPERMRHALERDVDLTALPGRVPPAVRELLGRCLERDRGRRLGEIRAARHALEDALGIRRAAALREGELAVPNNLPAAATSFVGREDELAECTRQMEGARWLTLCGMGGGGKTRLALRLAEKALDSYPGGVWFVDLTGLEHPERVAEKLAEAAGIRQEPGVPIVGTVTRSFGADRVMVVLDNCEELPQAVGRLAAELLAACPGITLLATSREPLGGAGEIVLAVAPLAVPDEGAPPDPASVAASQSVRLFVERAAAAKPGFRLDAANARVVAEICRRLDGIPLAIELAAARVRMLTVDEILARLGDRFRLLTAGGRGTPVRHQTLHATLRWSFDHLSADERELFVRLGVFAGAWNLESAVAVAGGERDEFEVLDALTRLVERSLAVVVPTADGGTRYRYLETVRHFALEQLGESGEAPDLRDRHLGHFLAVAEESERGLAGAGQKSWLARLDVEHADLLAAHAWCSGPERAASGLRLVGALWRYWSARGHYALAGRTMLEALARPGAEGPDVARANVLVRAGGNALTRGDYGEARPLVEESLAISRELGDRVGVARCLGTLSSIAIFCGDLEEARARSQESLELYRALGRPAGVAVSLHTLGYVALFQGDLDAARERYEEALQVLGRVGDERLLAHALSDSARVAARRGEQEEARIRLATALRLARSLGVRREAAYGLEGAAELAASQGDTETAIRLIGAAAGLREAIGSPATPAESQALTGLLARLRATARGDAQDAVLAAGRSLDSEQAVMLALDWLEQQPAGPPAAPDDPTPRGE